MLHALGKSRAICLTSTLHAVFIIYSGHSLKVLYLKCDPKLKDPHFNCLFSHDVMAVIFVPQNNETAAMFESQASPVGVELFPYVNAFFCSNTFA